MLEVLFNFRNALNKDRLRFESISFDIMKKMIPNFEFKIDNGGKYSDIAELYIAFLKVKIISILIFRFAN
jgi:hypothetical protein